MGSAEAAEAVTGQGGGGGRTGAEELLLTFKEFYLIYFHIKIQVIGKYVEECLFSPADTQPSGFRPLDFFPTLVW